jgi:hypothetical protein
VLLAGCKITLAAPAATSAPDPPGPAPARSGSLIKVAWCSPTYTYTHQKTLVIDRSKAVIMTANLTARYYPTTRDFLVVDSRRADVTAIVKVFNADYAHRPAHPGDGRDLVWSPTDSQEKLLALINGATGSLRIYSEEMGDTTMEDALIAAAKRGVSVRICGENQGGEFDSDFARLARGGVRISYYHSSSGFYIHGKIIEADYGTRHAKVFIGSENLSNTSLNQNRELGLITASHAVVSSIAGTFAIDFATGSTGPRPRRAGGPDQDRLFRRPRRPPPPGSLARQRLVYAAGPETATAVRVVPCPPAPVRRPPFKTARPHAAGQRLGPGGGEPHLQRVEGQVAGDLPAGGRAHPSATANSGRLTSGASWLVGRALPGPLLSQVPIWPFAWAQSRYNVAASAGHRHTSEARGSRLWRRGGRRVGDAEPRPWRSSSVSITPPGGSP